MTTSMLTSELTVAAAQLILRERQCRDRGWYGEMADTYFDDSHVRLSWFQGSGKDFVSASEQMSEQGQRNSHRIGAPVVRQIGPRFLIEAPAEIVFILDDRHATHLVSWTRLIYRVEQRDTKLGIVSLDVIYERDALFPVPDAPDRKAPRTSYAAMSALLSSRGYAVDPDLLGDDRPEEVESFYQRSLDWLHQSS